MDVKGLSRHLEVLLSEDLGSGDITAAITPNRRVRAEIVCKQAGYVSGIYELKVLFKNHGIRAVSHVRDGSRVRPGQRIFTLYGMSRVILPIERLALNLLSRMSAVTTITRAYVDELRKVSRTCRIAATRKTSPGLRYFEKKAVVLGGGVTHRFGLYDMILIKDNHMVLFGNDVRVALAAAERSKVKSKVEIEVTSVSDAILAVQLGADIVMFDNMSPPQVRKAVAQLVKMGLRGKVLLEVSGGINMKTLNAYGRCGVDWISIGRITHSAPAIDYSLEFL
jgi:nicotinate-nucleotide pyrophosphorylase (carboxylating)